MWGASQTTTKQTIRSAIQSQRRQLSPSDARDWSRSIQAQALGLAQYRAADAVALYSSIGNEVATREILNDSLQSGKSVYYPRIEPDKALALIRVFSARDFKPGPLGILEPTGEVRLDASMLRRLVVFVPGIAFDAQGNRLGHGKGYYDRLLERLSAGATLVALAYELQVVEAVPSETWDQKVHVIVTERRIIDCATTLTQSVQGL